MNIPLKHWTPGSHVTAAELNRMVEAIRRATPVAGKGISISQGLGGSVISIAKGSGGGSGAGGYAPFTMRVIDGALMVYLPKGCLQVTAGAVAADLMVVDTSKNAVTAHEDWYVAAEGYNATSYANREVYACVDIANSRFFIAGTSFFPADSYRFCIGKVLQDEDGTISPQQYVAGSVVIADRRGGGGSLVEVTDQRTDATKPGVVGYTGTSEGVVGFVARDGIGPDLVIFAMEGADIGTLLDYLAGRLDLSEAVEGGPYSGLGKNVSTDNFAAECLGPSLTPDAEEGVDDDKAAPSAHEHTLSQLVGPEGEPLSAQDVIDFFSNAGMWDALGESGPSGEGPSDDSILTVGDVETDDDWYKPDAAMPSAGDVSMDLLALSGHRHPLNVADVQRATGPTGEGATGEPTPPPAGDYVKAVGVGTTGPSGEASPTTAMHGSEPYYARVDHVHPICAEMGPTGQGATGEPGPSGGVDKSMPDGSGDTLPTGPSGITLDETTWTPGASGYVESYCTKVVNGSDGFTKYAIFRRRKISRTGAVVWVGPEYIGFAFAG